MFENASRGEPLTDSAETGEVTGKSAFLSKDLEERNIEMFKCLSASFLSLFLFPFVEKLLQNSPTLSVPLS